MIFPVRRPFRAAVTIKFPFTENTLGKKQQTGIGLGGRLPPAKGGTSAAFSDRTMLAFAGIWSKTYTAQVPRGRPR